ncbi:MAG: hypothetical protein K9M98_03525 [Cephaloticoccus sp.]|nr:hypothetical protein [Cephaloticoccus sp.]MCF7759551.1 hypothetical protein [Cephaloticoccus sp.]
MANRFGYRVIFSELAVESLVGWSKRKQRRILDRAHELATDPFLVPDFQTKDATGRDISHIMTDGFIFDFWVDHAVKQVIVTTIEEVD